MIKLEHFTMYKKIAIILLLLLFIPLVIILILSASFNNRKYYKLDSFSVYLNTENKNFDINKKTYSSVANNDSLDNLIPFEQYISDIYISLNKNSFSNNSFNIYNPFNESREFIIHYPENESLFYIVKYEDNLLNFYSPDQIIGINGESNKKLGRLEYSITNVGPNDIYKFNDKYIFIKNIINGEKYTLPKSYFEKEEVELIIVDSQNLLEGQNNDFSGGFWQSEVGNCSSTNPGIPSIQTKIINDIFGPSLNLSSKNHFACTNKRFSIVERKDPSQKFIFNLNYRNNKSNTGAYYLRFIDKTQKNIYDEIGNLQTITPESNFFGYLNSSNKYWVSSSAYYEPNLNNPFFIDIFLYSQSYGIESDVDFDNLSLYRVVDFKIVKIQKQTDNESDIEATKIKLLKGNNIISLPINSNNIIENDNYSFEQDTWQLTPIDCSSNEPGEPKFTIASSVDASNGVRAVNLISENHNACIYRKFSQLFNKNIVYGISIDFKIIEGNSGMYFIKVKSKNSNEIQTFSNQLKSNTDEWTTYDNIRIDELTEIEYIEVYLYANGSQTKTNILYDNIQIRPLYPRNYNDYIMRSTNPTIQKSPYPKKLNFVIGSFIDSIYSNEKEIAFYSHDKIFPEQLSSASSQLYNDEGSIFLAKSNGKIEITTNKFYILKNILFFYYIFVFTSYFFIQILKKSNEIESFIQVKIKNNYKIVSNTLYIIYITICLFISLFFNLQMGFYLLCGCIMIYLKFDTKFIKFITALLISISGILIIIGYYYVAENFVIFGFYSIMILLLQEFVIMLDNFTQK